MVDLVPRFLEALVNLLDIPPRLAHNQPLDVFQDHAPRAELLFSIPINTIGRNGP